MFTGIIEEVGIVKGVTGSSKGGRKFAIGCLKVMEDISIGDSLSVNGVCLTIVKKLKNEVNVEAVEETIKKTTLGGLRTGDPVNLERAVTLNSRIGGHLVQGHVDTTAKLMAIERLQMSNIYRFRLQRQYMKYLIPVGSVAVNGVSLTVAEKLADSFKVAIIPHTQENTTFRFLRVGSTVNVELDMMAKYVESLLSK
jgi:riboflavin synthase